MNGKKLGYVTVAVMALVCVHSTQLHAMTVQWAAAQTVELTLANQTTGLPVGSLVQLGNFGALTDPQIQAIGANPLSLQSAFQPWASGHIGDGTDNSSLGVGTFSINTSIPGTGFFGESMYLLVFNTSSSNTASQVAVIKGPTANLTVGDSWIFPSSDLSPAISVETADMIAGNVLIGSYGVNTFNSPWWGENVNALSLAVVPEPSTWMLVGAGILGMFVIRRRKQKT